MTELFYGTSGPRSARIAIVGESWGSSERMEQKPFVGQSGQEFTKMLNEAGIDRGQCFVTNLFADQPLNDEAWRFFLPGKENPLAEFNGLFPNSWARSEIDRLYAQLNTVKPELIIGAGNFALWAFTERAKLVGAKEKKTGKAAGVKAPAGIMNQRGSMLFTTRGLETPTKFLPIVHPAAIGRQWELRAPTVHDLRARVPMALEGRWTNPLVRTKLAPPSYEDTINYLDSVVSGPMVVDVETLPSAGHLVCIGLCQSSTLAISIPFLNVVRAGWQVVPFWSVEEQAQIIKRLRKVLTRPDVEIIGQNFTYDQQWIARDLGVVPRPAFDTMIAQQVLWPGTPRGLDYLSSLYCAHHVFWKEDSNEWNFKENGLQSELEYNCEDLFVTLEVATELRGLVSELGMDRQFAEIMEETQRLQLNMMLKGVKIDTKLRATMGVSLMLQASKIAEWFEDIFPNAIFGSGTDSQWYQSPLQTQDVLYKDFGLRTVVNRKTKSTSAGKEALEELSQRYPRLRKIFSHLKALRSLETFQSHFIQARLEETNRMKCSYGYVETFRWNSNKNAFKRGTNLQNLPSGNEDGDD